MNKRSVVYDFLAVLSSCIVVYYSLMYAYVVYTFDIKTLFVSVVLPVCFGTVILSLRKEKIYLYAFLAYIWAVVDDAPVYFDSVLTWPEVTRFHPFLPRLLMNIVLHALTLTFLYLTVRESFKGRVKSRAKVYEVGILAFMAFILAYAQNIPLAIVQNFEVSSWYTLDVLEKLASLVFLCLAIREARASTKEVGPTVFEHR